MLPSRWHSFCFRSARSRWRSSGRPWRSHGRRARVPAASRCLCCTSSAVASGDPIPLSESGKRGKLRAKLEQQHGAGASRQAARQQRGVGLRLKLAGDVKWTRHDVGMCSYCGATFAYSNAPTPPATRTTRVRIPPWLHDHGEVVGHAEAKRGKWRDTGSDPAAASRPAS